MYMQYLIQIKEVCIYSVHQSGYALEAHLEQKTFKILTNMKHIDYII